MPVSCATIKPFTNPFKSTNYQTKLKDYSSTMTSFQVPVFDTSRFPLPTRAFIGGEFVDSTGDEKHTLISSVNDQILTNGSDDLSGTVCGKADIYQNFSGQMLETLISLSNPLRKALPFGRP